MASISSTISSFTFSALTVWPKLVATVLTLLALRMLYNISPFHPLARYPGPVLWRLSRLPAAYHHCIGDLYKLVAEMHAKYGSVVRLAPDELSFANPEAWPAIYNSRPQLEKSRYHFPPAEYRNKIPPNMIVAPDVEHARLRRLTGPAFLNSGIAEIEPVLQHRVTLLCAKLSEASTEGPQDMVLWLLWALNDVIGQLALGEDFRCLETQSLHPWPAQLLSMLKSSAVLNSIRRFGISLKLLAPFIPKAVLQKQKDFFATSQSAITKRLAKEKGDKDQEESADPTRALEKQRIDLVTIMLREMKGGDHLTEAEILSNSILFIAAGAETTSTCLSAAVYHLCTTPHAMQRLKDEIRGTFASPDDITLKAVRTLPYLEGVINESLRVFPVASYLPPRITPKQGLVVNGESIPGGTYLSMNQWYMGRSSLLFDDAGDFRPERWIERKTQGVSAHQVDEILRPFSLGPRNCAGKLLALAEARLVLAKLIWHFDLEIEGDHSTWVKDARFFTLWQLQQLSVRLTALKR